MRRTSTASKCSFSYVDQQELEVTFDGQEIWIIDPRAGVQSHWTCHVSGGQLWLEAVFGTPTFADESHWLAAFEVVFASYGNHNHLCIPNAPAWPHGILHAGIFVALDSRIATVTREALWQCPRLWITNVDSFPSTRPPSRDNSTSRSPKPGETLYRRHIAWLGKTLTFRTIDLEQDLHNFNRWMNEPLVAKFWQQEGDITTHRSYIEGIAQNPCITALIGCFDSEPFGYFETYWAKGDRIAPFYDVEDFDRGWHALVGEAQLRGKPYVTAWMPSISHYLFLDDLRTKRIVVEPRVDNDRMIRSLQKNGFAILKEFDFPHKRAVLAMLHRKRFFNEIPWTSNPLNS